MSDGPARRRRIAGEPRPSATPASSPRTKARKPAVSKPVKPLVSTPVTSKPTKPAVFKPAIRPAAETESTIGNATGGDTRTPRTYPSGRELRWLVPATVVALAILVGGLLLAVRGVADARKDTSVAESSSQAAAAAGQAAETIFSYRYDQLDAHLKDSKALMTPSFQKDFDKIAPALTKLAPQRKIQVEAVVRGAAALSCGDECSPTKATVLVFVDQARLATGSKKPTVFGNRIKMTMIKKDNGWLVDEIRAL